MVSDLEERMKRADWWWSYSDDGTVRQRGMKEIDALYKDLRKLAETDMQAAKKLWADHSPKEWFAPNFLTAQAVDPDAEKDFEEFVERRAEREHAMVKGIFIGWLMMLAFIAFAAWLQSRG